MKRPSLTSLALSAVLTCSVFAALTCSSAQAATFTVNTITDTTDGVCDADCSLREAITAANGAAGDDTINFNIPGLNPRGGRIQTIELASVLPTITDTVTVDGYSQPGAKPNTLAIGTNAVLLISIDGNRNRFHGLTISAANCTVKGLAFNNCYYGISLNGATGSVVSGNHIGPKADGSCCGGNSVGVTVIAASNNTIGGTAAADRNVISYNSTGIQFSSDLPAPMSGNKVQGNYIGTTIDGMSALHNDEGIEINGCSGTTIGGTTAAERNVISGNSSYGIYIAGNSAQDNKVQGNYIGTKADGITALGNREGVYIAHGMNNTVGGIAAGEGNIISGNTGAGISLTFFSSVTGGGTGNVLRGNSIFANGGLGIDLNAGTQKANEVTANDTNDGDVGANNLQNFPVLTSAVSGSGGITIAGTLNSTANTTFLLDFYDNVDADPSGYGEGKTYLGSGAVTTVGNDGSFSTELTGPTVPGGHFITATATDPDGNTSEFSQVVVAVPTLSISDTTITESDTGTINATFMVTLSQPNPQDVSVDYATADGTAQGAPATQQGDYTSTTGTLIIPAGQTTGTILISVTGDTLDEVDETFSVNLSNPVNATIAGAFSGSGLGLGTIIDNDPAPTLSINDVSLAEGDPLPNGGFNFTDLTFTVTLSAPSSKVVTVDYATADGNVNPARSGTDYMAVRNTTLTFTPGETTKTFTVSIIGDVVDENDETFFATLSNATNATIVGNQGLGTINDDDELPSLRINDVIVTEGPAQGVPAGTTNATFNVTLSAPSGRSVFVKLATGTPGSNAATADVDYVSVPLTTLIFLVGETSKTVTVQVKGDTTDEVDERFAVKLSSPTFATIADSEGFGTIIDDDAPPSLAVNDVTVTEGNTGTTPATFTVSLSAPSGKTVTVQYLTNTPSSVPATAGIDYVATPATTLTFLPGETSKTFTIQVNGDTTDEDNERFSLNLKNAGNATIADKEGFCTINDDDAPPGLRINDISLAEGNSGTTFFAFTVNLSVASGKTVKVNYQTTSPNSLIATPGTDYIAVPLTTLTFAPGETSKPVIVLVNGDTTVEGTERFAVKLSSAVNATIADNEGFGTITNDDVAPLLVEDDAPSE